MSSDLRTLSSAGERFLHTEEVAGSNPLVSTTNADLAQLAEQLICNHQVVGSSPIVGTIIAGVAELADALDLESSGETRAGSSPVSCTNSHFI